MLPPFWKPTGKLVIPRGGKPVGEPRSYPGVGSATGKSYPAWASDAGSLTIGVGSARKINSKLIRAQHEKIINQAGITVSNINCGPPGPLG